MNPTKPKKFAIVLNQVEAYTKATEVLNKIYGTDDGKKFIHHIVHAFSSNVNSYVVISKHDLYDCLSKSKLKAVYQYYNEIPTEIRELMTKYKSEEDATAKSELSNLINNKIDEILKESPKTRLAIRSSLTNKILGLDEFQALVDFVKSQVEAGNQTLIRMVKYYHKPKNSPKAVKSKAKSKQTKPSNRSLENNYDGDLRSKLMKAVQK